MKTDVINTNLKSIERMKTADIQQYATNEKVPFPVQYIIGAVLGLFGGGITFMKINTMEFMSIFIALLVAALTSITGATATLVFNKFMKKPLDRFLSRVFERKKKRKRNPY